MIEYLEFLDKHFVLWLNGMHTPWLDECMWWISARITWLPLYILIVFIGYRNLPKQLFWAFIGLAVLSVILTDLLSVHLFKNVFLRYRPSHNLDIAPLLHYYEIRPGEYYKGGMYGFVSSHAANFFAIVSAVWFALRFSYPKLPWIVACCGIFIILSRVYLGVHYLSDTIVGAALGISIGSLIFRFFYVPLQQKLSA